MSNLPAAAAAAVNDFRLGWNAWVRFSDVPRDPARRVGWMTAARENEIAGLRPEVFRREDGDDEVIGMMRAHGIKIA